MQMATEFLVSTFYTTDDGKCNPETSIVLILCILIWIKMANFKSVVLFLKVVSLFIVQRNFGKHLDLVFFQS